jgi:predicted glycosyltransferase
MLASSRSKRVLLYSHDSFGLGHVSRCRTIANAIVEADHSVSVLIISGSPMIGSYEFRSGIDFVRVPGVVKQIETGEYDSANLRVGVEHTLEMRTRIIRDTADIYRPDLFIVDKEPTGLRGEVVPALHLLKERGTPLVLGLRDVMDDPAALAQEWERKNVVPALRDLYDEIWIYGLPQINKPLTGIAVPPSVRHKMFYTGYLYRDLPLHIDIPHEIEEIDGPFILVTAGGGGDGADLIDWVLAAYESDRHLPYGAVIVFGRRARGLQGARREVPQHPHAHLHQQSRRIDAACRGRGGDGRLQHVLRDPVVRQEGDHRAAHQAPARAVHPRPRRAQCRADRDARRRPRPRSARHGDGAQAAAATGPAERRRRAGPA